MAKTYSPSAILGRVDELYQGILNAGWDDAILYSYEVTAYTEEDLLKKLLDQPQVVPPTEGDAAVYPLASPASEYGLAVSFGGWVQTDMPNAARIMSYEHCFPEDKNPEIETMAAEVLGAYLQLGVTEAERVAKELIAAAPDGLLPNIRRGFLRVLVPVNYHGA